VTAWVDVNVKVIPRQTAVNNFNTPYFDNAVAFFGVNTCGFSIENNLAHGTSTIITLSFFDSISTPSQSAKGKDNIN
jgi:hypothetical protein